jgi:hypothetical protein
MLRLGDSRIFPFVFYQVLLWPGIGYFTVSRNFSSGSWFFLVVESSSGV